MNRLPGLRSAALAVLALLLGAGAASAAPRYTDRENAQALAKALDKGIFRNNLIESTFIQSLDGERYFIKVVLDNGTSQDWTLEQIHAWSKAEAILLASNRVLLFPSEERNDFVILDKNAFVHEALRARVYVKRYRGDDPLAGTSIAFAVRGFNLVELLGLAPGWDSQGYRHQYVLDLMNGQREILSYLDAYETMSRGGLMPDPAGPAPVMEWPYFLREVRPHEVGAKDENGIARFALELVFTETVRLGPEHFPVQVFESGDGGRNFVLQVTVPNAELGGAIPPIPALEYLNGIRAQADARHAKRVLLQARVSPDVLEFPPQVEVRDTSVRINFLKVVDQTVLSRKSLLEANLRRQQEQLLGMRPSEEQRRRREAYVLAFETGFGQLEKARDEADVPARIALLTTALVNFRDAALNASTDLELRDALRERNNLTSRIPILVAGHVRGELEKGLPLDPEGLKRMISTAAALTRDLEMLRSLRELMRKLEP
jgi:hypothetical protein